MRILLLNHQQNTRPLQGRSGSAIQQQFTSLPRPSVFSFVKWKWVSHLPGPFKPGSGPACQSRVWRPCRWQVLQSLCTEGCSQCPAQPGQQRALPCHADCSCSLPGPAAPPQGGPPSSRSVWRRCAIHIHPLSEKLSHPLDQGHWVSTQASFQTLWRIRSPVV